MKTNNVKSVPERMCVVCKEMLPKRDLLRIVKNKDGEIFIDNTHKANGRGAYLCRKDKCIETCFKKKFLNKAFKTEINAETYEKLIKELENENR